MRYIVRAVPARREFVAYLSDRIPNLIVVEDTEHCARETRCAVPALIRAMQAAGDDAALHLEDDIVLTKDFVAKVDDAIWERPKEVIQFFSMRGADLTIGSRREPGRSFMMAQCFYLPAGFSAELVAFESTRLMAPGATGQDTLIKEWLIATRRKYWLHVPSLVDHRQVVSAIDPRRSRNRISKTFKDPDQ